MPERAIYPYYDHVINNNVVNVYIVYKSDTIASSRDTTFTIQNALFGKMQYLIIIFTNEHQKLLHKEIFKKINKNINRNCVKIKFESTDKLPLNVLVNICSLILVVRYQRVYLNTCWYDQFYNRIQIKDTVR